MPKRKISSSEIRDAIGHAPIPTTMLPLKKARYTNQEVFYLILDVIDEIQQGNYVMPLSRGELWQQKGESK